MNAVNAHPTLAYYNVQLGLWRAACVCGFETWHDNEDAATKDAAWHRSRIGGAA